MEIDRYLLDVEHGGMFGYDEFVERVASRMNYDDLALEASDGTPAPVNETDVVYRRSRPSASGSYARLRLP